MSTLPTDYTGDNTGAEIAVAKSGKFVFASNRGHDSILTLAIHPVSGLLTPTSWINSLGKGPRFFALAPNDETLYAANENSDSIVALMPKPQVAQVIMASFASVTVAADAVAAIISAGIIPAGLEMMDKRAISAVEPFAKAGYDTNAAAILLCESDGTPELVDDEIKRMTEVLSSCGACQIKVSRNEAERLRYWSGRKAAFPAVGRITPDYLCMDGTIPRKRLGEMLAAIEEMEEKYRLRCANVFHAGDGNLHPLILFDANDPDDTARALAFGGEILELSVKLGGTITGEHGVGIEKLEQMRIQFSTDELQAFSDVKSAFDPVGLLNPGKVIPTAARCKEYRQTGTGHNCGEHSHKHFSGEN